MANDRDADSASGGKEVTAAQRKLRERVMAQFFDEIFGHSAELEWTELPDGRPGLLADDVLFTLRGDELEVTGEMESGNPGVVVFDPSGSNKRIAEAVPPDPIDAAMN
jgi:hypothetical protein